jgi:hypothetical protein
LQAERRQLYDVKHSLPVEMWTPWSDNSPPERAAPTRVATTTAATYKVDAAPTPTVDPSLLIQRRWHRARWSIFADPNDRPELTDEQQARRDEYFAKVRAEHGATEQVVAVRSVTLEELTAPVAMSGLVKLMLLRSTGPTSPTAGCVGRTGHD